MITLRLCKSFSVCIFKGNNFDWFDKDIFESDNFIINNLRLDKMTRGNQREIDREKARKRNEENNKKNEKSDFLKNKDT